MVRDPTSSYAASGPTGSSPQDDNRPTELGTSQVASPRAALNRRDAFPPERDRDALAPRLSAAAGVGGSDPLTEMGEE
jgi:hypothetical protein